MPQDAAIAPRALADRACALCTGTAKTSARSPLPALIFQSLRIPRRYWQAYEIDNAARYVTAVKQRNSPLIMADWYATRCRQPCILGRMPQLTGTQGYGKLQRSLPILDSF